VCGAFLVQPPCQYVIAQRGKVMPKPLTGLPQAPAMAPSSPYKSETLRIATHNVRTLSENIHWHHLESELENIKWDVVGPSEVRRPGETSFCPAEGGKTIGGAIGRVWHIFTEHN